VQIRPPATVEASYAEKARLRARRQEQYRALRDMPAVTKDGVAITLQMNAGLLVDMPQLSDVNAEGVGLFRTEILFMVAPSMPRAEAQEALYRAILQSAGGKPVTFRTLDIGGDKILPYMRKVEEENPALGWRAIRIGLDRPALLKAQLRAILKACAGRTARIMLPMVATVEEYTQAKAMLDRERAYLTKHGHQGPRDVKLGVMLEVPSLLFDLDNVLKHVDFLSIGSNDLMQFMFAVDRDNRRVSTRFDTLNPSMMRALRRVAKKANAVGKPATVCGEMGGRPLEAMALLAMGFRSLSMSPASVGPVKAMLLALDVGKAAAALDQMLTDCDGCPSLRSQLERFAEDNGVPV
jgi:phosphotransferase system, enzyme I, PtsP